jgi:predicted kinase
MRDNISPATGGTVWVVAGPPGSGKTTVAELLAARLSPPGALLDKDTVYGGFVTAILQAAGRPIGEREGPWYDDHIKTHEYAGLSTVAREIRSSGCPVVLVAPYTDAIHNQDRWGDLVASLGGEPVRLVWIDVDVDTLKGRLLGRASERDGEKLTAFEAFARRMRPGEPPAVNHYAVDNRGALDAVYDQVAQLLADPGS